MPPINWYSVRHYLKWTLVAVTLLFFAVTILQLLFVRQKYISRYVEMHLEDRGPGGSSSPSSPSTIPSSSLDGGKHVFSVDEEVDFNGRFNLSSSEANGTDFAVNAEQKGPPLSRNSQKEEKEFSGEVKLLTGIIVAAIIIIELLYCLLYLYVVARKRFCSMFVFSMLSLCSLGFHIQLHLTIQLEDEDNEVLERTKDLDESLEAEHLLNHITRSSLTEVILSVLETVLSLAYSAVLYKFPGRETLQSRYRLGFFRLGGGNNRRNNHHIVPGQPVPNGHAVSMEMQSIDGDAEDGEIRNDNNHHQVQNHQNDTSSSSSSSLSINDLNPLHQRPPGSSPSSPPMISSPSTIITTTTTVLQSPGGESDDHETSATTTTATTSH